MPNWRPILTRHGIDPDDALRRAGLVDVSDAASLARLAAAYPAAAADLLAAWSQPLAGQTALVTGTTSGYGAAIARRLLDLGATVIGTGRRADRLAAQEAELGPNFRSLCFDVRNDDATDSALAGLTPDILVNNAGLALGLNPAQAADWDDWETMIATNIRALTRITHAVLPGMVARGRGHVVNIASVAGSWPYPGGNVYGASKAFVIQFTLNLRAELNATPVRATSIEPGLSDTEFSLVRFKGDAGAAAGPYRGMSPLVADDIADAVAWAVTRPAHVNVNRIEIMPTAQGFGAFAVHRA